MGRTFLVFEGLSTHETTHHYSGRVGSLVGNTTAGRVVQGRLDEAAEVLARATAQGQVAAAMLHVNLHGDSRLGRPGERNHVRGADVAPRVSR